MQFPMKVRFTALGAGQEVGRSCFLLTFAPEGEGETVKVLLDAGAHVKSSEARFPEKARIPEDLDAVLVTHYHLDHAGALPWLKELAQAVDVTRTKLLMTAPTKLLAPLVLQEFAAANGAAEREGGGTAGGYLAVHIERTFAEVGVVGLGERRVLETRRGERIAVTTFYAGHVLGGVMVQVEVRGVSVVYTGDYSAVADGLMDGARVPKQLLPPAVRGGRGVDLVISESTYATSVRECVDKRRARLVRSVESCVGSEGRGGVVLVPVLSVGRAQEMACLMMSSEIIRNSNTKFYTTSSVQAKAFKFFPLFRAGWWRETGDWRLPRAVKLVETFEEVDASAPAVVFTAPPALEGGKALEFFARICGERENLVCINGYCPQGTVGNRLIFYHSKRTRDDQRIVQLGPDQSAVVQCAIDYIPFTGHTDKVGILQILKELNPKNVILVHGENERMQKLAHEIGPHAQVPANFETLQFDFEELVSVEVASDGGLLEGDGKIRSTVRPEELRVNGAGVFPPSSSALRAVRQE